MTQTQMIDDNPDVRRKLLEWREVRMPDGHYIATSVTAAETALLQGLAAGKNVLEIGAGYGYSAIQMAKTANHVTSIDPHAGELANSYEAMEANLARYNVENVTIVREYSQDALPTIRKKFGLVFVDGNHDTQVRSDVYKSILLLNKGGILACHDYYEWDFPDIAKVLDGLPFEPLIVVDTMWVGRP